ncbi:hypothetical protein CANTEDRAFT_111570 [Yamadazyma tenuis ATCC 10573]|uniref:LicD/FKTN/FKRP nucleotidyltransferase domain-containing protein n=2 Tax=Candida tenuis TaxID=2315449 RepID=G3BC37_CANTC|nr:uncharacterized protein CANTEDRAFT_111570 [Yamadazyma tenuis ATCC 10573]EGV60774.1 hypothetical protein CANTEDRAFT_111570 [Yamadazyma tenuis ATCC 10573]
MFSAASLKRQYSDLRVIGDRLRLQQSVSIKLHRWYSDFLHNEYDFDQDPRFNAHVEKLLEKHQSDPELWSLTKRVADLPLSVTIPEYFNPMTSSPKPIMQPFDPRFTLSVYFQWMKHHVNEPVVFHWSDWVDLSKLTPLVFNNGQINKCEDMFDISGNEELIRDSEIRHINDYCHNYFATTLGYKITSAAGPQTIENNELIGKSFLYTTFEPPTKLVLMNDDGLYEVPVSNRNNNMKYSLLNNKYVEKLKLSGPVEVTSSYKAMVKAWGTPTIQLPPVKKEVKLDKTMFMFDAKDKIKQLRAVKKRTLNQDMYLNSLEVSIKEGEPPKYFHEAKLLQSYKEHWLGEHYDWRFFNGLTVGKGEQMISLCKLIKAYLDLCITEGLVTWIAHGSLLSWYWNGSIFPWDTDLDVQMPIAELNKLAERFNQSLVVENVMKNGQFSGMGKYFVDVGSSITYREKGNGNNNIDGRFIDTDTGLYVDITALAITNTLAPTQYDSLPAPEFAEVTGQENFHLNLKHGLANCRNDHFVKVDEVNLLKPIHFQDQTSYLSTNFLIMINNEYELSSMTEKNYRDYIYLKNFRIWVNTQNILDYMKNSDEWVAQQNGQVQAREDVGESSSEVEGEGDENEKRVVGALEKLQINKLGYNDYFNLLEDKTILKDYLINRNNSANHQEELDKLMYSRDTGDSSKFLENNFIMDLFINRIYETGWNYDQEVNKMVGLSQLMNKPERAITGRSTGKRV